MTDVNDVEIIDSRRWSAGRMETSADQCGDSIQMTLGGRYLGYGEFSDAVTQSLTRQEAADLISVLEWAMHYQGGGQE